MEHGNSLPSPQQPATLPYTNFLHSSNSLHYSPCPVCSDHHTSITTLQASRCIISFVQILITSVKSQTALKLTVSQSQMARVCVWLGQQLAQL